MANKQSRQTFITDAGSVELDDSCGMKLWWTQYESGSGIQKKEDILNNLLKAEIHEDLRVVSTLEDLTPAGIQPLLDEILAGLSPEDKQETKKMELLYRRLGWLAAFALFIEPEIRENYETLPIQREIILDRDPLWVVVQPDRVLRSKRTQETVYREYVPMPAGWTKQTWLQGWLYRMRLHIGIAAAESAMKMVLSYGQAMGLSEGFISSLDGRLMHPYVWGYYNKKREEWAHTFRAEAEDWKPAPVWEFPGGVVAWVRMCGKHIADSQFPMSPAVQLNHQMLTTWVSRRLHRERQLQAVKNVAQVNPAMRGIHFERRTEACMPAIGPACPFLKACWSPEIELLPLKSGEYVRSFVDGLGVIEGVVVS